MVEFVEGHRSEVEDLCRRHGVRKLEVFGSAANDSFDPAHSDVDLLVEFEEMPPAAHSRAYFSLWFALQDLFDRNVDLVETSAVTNPFFLRAIDSSRRVLYAA
jgi:predicted nucleotidyltransferase